MVFLEDIQHRLEYLGLRTLSLILTGLPSSISYALIQGLATFVYFLGIRRKVSMTNLVQALGLEMGPTALAKICRASYRHIAMTFAELLMKDKIKDRISEIMDMPDTGLLREKIKKKRGLVLVSAHFGGWELVGAAIAAAGIQPITGLGTRQANPYVDDYITRARTELGMTPYTPDIATRHMVKALKANGAIGMVTDQNAGRHASFIDFFGRKAATHTGAAQLAIRYKAPLMVIMAIRTRPGHYRTVVRDVEILDQDTAESLTQRYTSIIEGIIRQHPEQYLWMHRRWKTRPPEEEQDKTE